MSDAKYPSQLAERFQIRMPDGLRDKIRAAAEENKRSMNTEIIARLEESFNPLGRSGVFGVSISIPDEDRREAALLASAIEEYMRKRPPK
jgi:hypothetical protein